MINPKLKLVSILSLLLVSQSFAYASDSHDHEHHDHDHHGHDHAHEHHDEEHDHNEKQAGPNGGRIVTSVEPHFEFFVMKDGKVQITFFDDHNKLIPPTTQKISLIGGDRSNPTKLKFETKGKVLISDKALPSKNNLPIILQIKLTPDSKTIREKFNLNLSQCPTCEYKEYACTCKHGEHDPEMLSK